MTAITIYAVFIRRFIITGLLCRHAAPVVASTSILSTSGLEDNGTLQHDWINRIYTDWVEFSDTIPLIELNPGSQTPILPFQLVKFNLIPLECILFIFVCLTVFFWTNLGNQLRR
jgi:hypothetical protein